MDERRMFERLDTALEATLIHWSSHIPCVICDISEGGVGIIVKKSDIKEKLNFSYGTELKYKFNNDPYDLKHECFFVYMKETEDEYRIGAVSLKEDLENR